MKTKIVLTFLALLSFMACTKKPAVVQHEFVMDKYGVVQRIDSSEKNIYLVFTAHYSTNDSGYFENFDGIEPVLNTLQEKGVKGSFFPTGNCYREPKYRESILRIIRDGHYLSHHSSRHLLLCPESGGDTINLVSADSIRKDLDEMEALMTEFGLNKEDYIWMIPPYETYNQYSADALCSCGYKLVNPTQATLVTGLDWIPEHGTFNYRSYEDIMDVVWQYEQQETLNGAVLLIHAMHYPDRPQSDRLYARLGEIIDHLRELGYDFRTFKDLIEDEKQAQSK